MSDETQGADVGPLEPMHTPAPAESEPIKSDVPSLRDAADSLASGRAAERAPEEIRYNEPNPDGTRSDRHLSLRKTLSTKEAAADLSEFRARRIAEREQVADGELASAIDSIRSGLDQPRQRSPVAQPQAQGWSQEQLNAAQAQQVVPQQYAPGTPEAIVADWNANGIGYIEVYKNIAAQVANLNARIGECIASGTDHQDLYVQRSQAQENLQNAYYVVSMGAIISAGYHPEIAASLARPKVLELVDSIRQVHEQTARGAIDHAWELAKEFERIITGIFNSQIPELVGKSAIETNAIMSYLERNQPERAQEIQNLMATKTWAAQQAMTSKQLADQWREHQMKEWRHQQDLEFDRQHLDVSANPVVKAATEYQAMQYLLSKGFTREQIKQNYSDPIFRNANSQSVLLDALRYHQAKQGVHSKRYAEPMRVLKPGSGEDRIGREPAEKLPASMSAKQATAALLARRARRG